MEQGDKWMFWEGRWTLLYDGTSLCFNASTTATHSYLTCTGHWTRYWKATKPIAMQFCQRPGLLITLCNPMNEEVENPFRSNPWEVKFFEVPMYILLSCTCTYDINSGRAESFKFSLRRNLARNTQKRRQYFSPKNRFIGRVGCRQCRKKTIKSGL